VRLAVVVIHAMKGLRYREFILSRVGVCWLCYRKLLNVSMYRVFSRAAWRDAGHGGSETPGLTYSTFVDYEDQL